jgi:hypothetical protein
MTLMAEPGRAADETVAAPNAAPTEASDPAWSHSDDIEEQKDIQDAPAAVRESWRNTWRIAGAILLGGVVLAGGIFLGRWLYTTPGPANQPPATASTSKGATPAPAAPASSSAPAAPSSIASTPDQDNKYIQALNNRGISFANPDAAVYNGKMVCQDIGQGMSVPQIVAAFRASNPALGNDANAYVAISVRAYCPQNADLVAGS